MHRVAVLATLALTACAVAAGSVSAGELHRSSCGTQAGMLRPAPVPGQGRLWESRTRTAAPSSEANEQPAFNAFVFDRDGNFRGTEHLTHADLFHGQPCPQSAWVFIPPIGYYECQHF
jgi:hypothetical protein